MTASSRELEDRLLVVETRLEHHVGRAELESLAGRIDARLARIEARLDALITSLDARFAALPSRWMFWAFFTALVIPLWGALLGVLYFLVTH